jgi:restriction system protein
MTNLHWPSDEPYDNRDDGWDDFQWDERIYGYNDEEVGYGYGDLTLTIAQTRLIEQIAQGLLDQPTGALLQATIIDYGDQTVDGQLVRSVCLPWFEIVRRINRDRDFLYHLTRYPRKFEELIAGAYERAGWPEVQITPRSNDGGSDVIAAKPGVGAIRFLDQAKAYSPDRLVTHDDIRAMLGVLAADSNASKALVTTTSGFQPRIWTSPQYTQYMPYRLELKDGDALRKWLIEIARRYPEFVDAV